ncbi:J domain-containing protein [Moorella naiadis]|uniref:DnaJ C-terminal domain-containing protein n=1 Tax=Moorella naiadis (nom. illeg.) TaxID=3093670 RepID=UPI003D9C995D
MAATYQDYYQILGVKREATPKEIKAAYRRLARQWHPDLHTGKEKQEAEEKFKLINEAYAVLSDPEKRTRYDRLGANWQAGQDFQPPDMGDIHFYTSAGFQPDAGSDFSDFFKTLFGDLYFNPAAVRSGPGRRRRRPARGPDVESELAITLEEAYRGTTRDLELAGEALCPDCGGMGVTGRGQICARCGGTGNLSKTRILAVKIPPGIQDGERIRLKGQGGPGRDGGGAGDLYLRVRLLPHPTFTVKGRDVETGLTLRPEEAVLGARLPVPTMDGPVVVTVPANSRSGTRLRLRGKGLPTRDGRRGDQYVRLTIDIPAELTEEERSLYRQLKELRRSGSK